MKQRVMIALLIGAATATGASAQSQATGTAQPVTARKFLPDTRTEALEQARSHFTTLDRNKDGFIARDELPARQRPSGEAMKAMHDRHFEAMDTDRNGQISKAEFDAFHAKAAAAHQSHEGKGMMRRGASGHGMMAMMFQRLDSDKDGKVSRAEAEAGALARFDRVDTDRDGKISDAERAAVRRGGRQSAS